MNKKKNRNSSAGTDADSDKKQKVTTSSHACSNTFVVRSPKSVSLIECQNKISVNDDDNGKWLLYNTS